MPSMLSATQAQYSPAIFLDTGFRPSAAGHDPLSLSDHLRRLGNLSTTLRYSRNETIIEQDDPVEHVYQVVSGMVRVCRYMPDGRRYIVDFLMAGDLMGFIESADHPASVEAVTPVTLTAWPRSAFDRLIRENADARSQLLCHLSADLLTAHQHLFVLGCQKARERVASFLLRLADRMDLGQGARLDLPMCRQDIADHLGLTVETICRVFSALKARSVIQLPCCGQVILRDIAMLRALAAEG